MTSETVYSVELVSRMTYLSANSSRGTYTGTLRRNVPSLPVTTGECPFSVPSRAHLRTVEPGQEPKVRFTVVALNRKPPGRLRRAFI